ncbi:MAG: ABC transporter ATP-binding protein [Thermoanaerobaculia bacterium]
MTFPTTARDSEIPVSFEQVTKSYGAVPALSALDLRIAPGELVALLGPNGAGKTTAVRMLLGLATVSAGRVLVFGKDPREPVNRVRTGAMLQVGKVPETLKVREHIDLFSAYYPAPLPLSRVVAMAGLEGLAERPFGELSGGQKQRVLFALALCGDPDLLVLDEPTVGLDVGARRALWEQIRLFIGRGKSVLLTTHHLEEADALAERIVVIDHGIIVAQGSPTEIKARCSGRKIRCSTRLSRETLLTLPGVTSVSAATAVSTSGSGSRSSVEILSGSAESTIAALLSRDPETRDLEVTGAGLEEAFLALTDPSENRTREVA